MDEAVKELVENVKRKWNETWAKTQEHIKEIADYGKPGRSKEETTSLRRLNDVAQDGLPLLASLIFTLDQLAPQLPTEPEVESARQLLESWNTRIRDLGLNLRNANLQAVANMNKAAQEERELLQGGGEKSTSHVHNLQTKAGMASASERITKSVRPTPQMMATEVERISSLNLDDSAPKQRATARSPRRVAAGPTQPDVARPTQYAEQLYFPNSREDGEIVPYMWVMAVIMILIVILDHYFRDRLQPQPAKEKLERAFYLVPT